MKSKTIFTCSSCGYQSAKWVGRCPDCGEWNTMVEKIAVETKSSPSNAANYQQPVALTEVESGSETRFSSGICELDRVLGGGIVQGSLVLVGGEPGIGKSTLLLQICQNIAGEILYVSGEESASQIKMRAKRLLISNDGLSLLCNTNLDNILSVLESKRPKVAIIDSVQTVSSPSVSSAPGSVSQIREVTHRLMWAAKSMQITIFIVGHVTKEGSIAGPRVLEHMVDCVLYFEGENNHTFRLLRAVKNRFGSTNEVGIFEMSDDGLHDVLNPSIALLEDREMQTSGTCITCTIEGTRPILTEVQALVTPTFFPVPRRTASGVDYNRMVLLLAVLEKRLKLNLSNYDAYLNIAGGMRLSEPASDLGVALAIYSNYKDIIIPPSIAVFGEIGLSGEIRPVPMVENRVKEAKKLGFEKLIIPNACLAKLKDKAGVFGARTLSDAVKLISD